jgi:hypothetical protein
MYCMLCGKKIDESRGYFTMFIRGVRYNYHMEHRPTHIPN